MLNQQLENFLAQQRQRGLYRSREIRNDERLINFSSNDYLSLSNHADIKKAYQEGFSTYPTGSGGSMVVCGYHAAHQSMESAFAKALKVDQCILFSSGYAACLSVGSLIARLNWHALIDKGVHASIYDGLRLAGAPFRRYLHQDLTDLHKKLRQANACQLTITESIFSMSGQRTPLAEMGQLTRRYKSALIVDEAHAFGTVGREGLGAVVAENLSQQDVPLRIIPLGKAFAASGAVVAGQKRWIDALLQCARPYIYSTAISPAFAVGLEHTLTVIRQADDRRKKLAALIHHFRGVIAHSQLTWRDSMTPIQQLLVGCPYQSALITKKLRAKGIICLPMRPPTVSKKETGLRVILNFNHEPEQLDFFMRCLDNI